MESVRTPTRKRCWSLAPAVMALVIAAVAGGVPAQARDHDEGGGWQDEHRDHEDHGRHLGHDRGRGHDRDDRDDRRAYELHSYGRPQYIYAPPPVYYAPQPAPPVIDFVFPLHIR